MGKRQPRRQPGAARREEGAAADMGIDCETNTAGLVRRHPTLRDLGDISGIVDRLDPVARHRLGFVDLMRHLAFGQRRHHQPIFVESGCRRTIIWVMYDLKHLACLAPFSDGTP